ncbi:LysR substrate-binding domain-containing protein [Pontibacterium sp.]|uniref:LysR family transcriptional regulator n=1 Tax=Pontibacterium sp. TaxID=2036026 RepID=UPI003516D115
MNLNDVRLFLRVVETNSFTAAAETLGIQKSTISRRIGQLEDDLGVRLLQRTTRKLKLTDEGQELFERCRPLIDELEQLPDLVSAHHSEPQGRLRITMPPEMGIFLMNDVIADFMRRYPKIQLELELSTRLADLIEEGIDLALRVGHLDDSSLIARKIASISSGLYASPEYINRNGTLRNPGELSQHSCLGRLSNSLHWEFENWNNGAPVPISARLKANNLMFMRDMAVQGLGIARLPKAFCRGEVERGALVQVLEEFHLPGTEVHALYPSRRHLSPKVRLFIDHLIQMLADHPWVADMKPVKQ